MLCLLVQAVAVVQRAMRQADPAEVMEELGFGQVYLVASFPVSMSGTAAACDLSSNVWEPALLCMALSNVPARSWQFCYA